MPKGFELRQGRRAARQPRCRLGTHTSPSSKFSAPCPGFAPDSVHRACFEISCMSPSNFSGAAASTGFSGPVPATGGASAGSASAICPAAPSQLLPLAGWTLQQAALRCPRRRREGGKRVSLCPMSKRALAHPRHGCAPARVPEDVGESDTPAMQRHSWGAGRQGTGG